MQILKSMSDGIGTAAGVAWPLFGVVSGSLSLTVGGLSAIILGSISSGIFLLVALPITIWSYKNILAEYDAIIKKHQDEENLFHIKIHEYLLALLRKYHREGLEDASKNANNIVNFILHHITIDQQSLKPNSKLFTLLDEIKNNLPLLERFIDAAENRNTEEINKEQPLLRHNFPSTRDIKQQTSSLKLTTFNHVKMLSKKTHDQIELAKVPAAPCITSGIVGFCAGFGTILGCTAGASGLLVGLGIFAGFAAIPVVGWAALGAAVLFGAIVATITIYNTYQKTALNQSISHYQDINSQLNEKIMRINIEIECQNKLEAEYEKEKNKIFENDKNFVPWIKNKDFKKSSTLNDSFIKSRHTQPLTSNPKHESTPTKSRRNLLN